MTETHVPVMTAEALEFLQPSRGGLFVDCTVGLGGHARALLEAGATRLIGLDRDPDALARARAALAPWADRVELVHADYRTLDDVLDARRIAQIDGALADLGVSSMQFDAPGRGFSFQRDEPLDMRMDRTAGETAAKRLRAGARLVVITFHSLEDRIVKHTLRALQQRDGIVQVLTKKPLVPRDDEIDRNPRARSAKLRAAERMA